MNTREEMRRVDQEYIIGIAIIVILVCVSICVYSTDDNTPGVHLPANDGPGQECSARSPGVL